MFFLKMTLILSVSLNRKDIDGTYLFDENEKQIGHVTIYDVK